MTSIRDILIARHARNVRKANPWPTGLGAITTRTKGATMAQDERAGVASGTEGEKGTELRPCDSEACVALRARQQVRVELARLQRDYETQRREDVVDEYQKAGKSWDTTRARLTDERDEARRDRDRFAQTIEFRVKELNTARTERDDLRTRLAERDAQVARLTKRLSEADAPTEPGFELEREGDAASRLATSGGMTVAQAADVLRRAVKAYTVDRDERPKP